MLLNNLRKIKPQVLSDSPRNFIYAFENILQLFKGLSKRRVSVWWNVDLTKRGVISLLPKKNKDTLPGVLLFIDFVKAFDSSEWNFLFKVLEIMNFGLMFRKWIHTFYFNITSRVYLAFH